MRTAALLLFGLVGLTVAIGAQTTGTPAAPASRNAQLEEALARLKAGHAYPRARTGRIELPSKERGQALDNAVEVPDTYDPAKRWPVRVSLHGGVGRMPPQNGGEVRRVAANRTPIDGEIVIHPRAWGTTEWWTAVQVDNISRLLNRVKRDYNVDESRVYITGISDGGTGVYFFAMREATPWAACMPLNGHPLVLANPDTGVEGQLYPSNLVNCPVHAVNGGRDQLYPAASVEPFIDMFRRAGGTVTWQVYPEARHDVSWWPEERSRYEAFLTAHVRAAHPPSISWETERTDRFNRFRWLVITRLGRRASDVPLNDVNEVTMTPGGTVRLYGRSRPSGRVDASRRGNAFELKTRGVQEVTLLLSRDVVDFSRPVRVTVNGKVVHEAVVAEDVATLNEWAGRDNDRTMLYTAALRVTVP